MPGKDPDIRTASGGGRESCRRILCVDDEPAIRLTVQAYLTDMGYEVSTAPDGNTALDLIDSLDFDAVLLDLAMPGLSGL